MSLLRLAMGAVPEVAVVVAAAGHFEHILQHFRQHCSDWTPKHPYLQLRKMTDGRTRTLTRQEQQLLLPMTTPSCWTCCSGPGCMNARYRRPCHHSRLEWDSRCHFPATDSAAVCRAMLALPLADEQTRIARSAFPVCWTLCVFVRTWRDQPYLGRN